MLRIIRQALLIAGLFSSISAFALDPQVFDLLVNKPLRVTIATDRQVTVYCDMKLFDTELHSLTIRMLNGIATIDGTTLSKNQTMTITIRQNQRVGIVATPGTDAQFTNLGPYAMKAFCTTI